MDFLTPEIIASYGFPMAVAGYLLVRMENVIKALTATVQENTMLVKALTSKVDDK